ncbi:MAG: short-chain fatty acyl-CoA regulator family protein, partial [Pseudomonadota bacterium]
PRLRQLRRARKQTQAEMAAALGLSASYVNLLENNQRSLSVPVLMRLADVYGVDWRELLDDGAAAALAELRAALQDPIFGDEAPDLQELRAALDHCPRLARSLLTLHKSHRALSEQALALSAAQPDRPGALPIRSPEASVHDLFWRNRNHFDAVEREADAFRAAPLIPGDEFVGRLKERLMSRFGVEVVSARLEDLPHALRVYDEAARVVRLSEALDYPNRAFQLAHVAGLLGARALFDAEISAAGVRDAGAAARCRVELANYFAAAVLMPLEPFLAAARETRYDLDRIAARFGVSVEQTCHRLTTLQRARAPGVPFFFLRVDKAGNVTKRFSAARFHLAEYGGACPRWDVHLAFRTPGRALPQLVETPDGARYFTINRTVDRPALGSHVHDHRQAITLGCAVEHAGEIVYADRFALDDARLDTPIGINCRLCPRPHCPQRAQQATHLEMTIDERRRGETRFES